MVMSVTAGPQKNDSKVIVLLTAQQPYKKTLMCGPCS